MLIDTHCHVLKEEYENPEQIIEESFSKGMDKIIINGYDLKTSKEAVLLAEKHKNVYAAVGISPQNTDNVSLNDILEIEKLLFSNKVVAVGEIGLDYYWTKENKDKQIEIFKLFLSLAEKHKLPVIIHSRNAIFDTYELLKKYNITGILHCYSGSLDMAKKFIKLGFLIGIGGVVTFKNSKEIKEIVKEIKIDDISLETDSPYLSPEPLRGKKNIPFNVYLVAGKIAEIKGISIDEVIAKTGNTVTVKFDL